MGTFHNDKGPLHGITVVVDTQGPQVYVGRCDTQDAERIVLLDADVHEEGEEGRSKGEYLRQVARVGHWNKLDRISIPTQDILTVRRLGEIQAE